MASYNKNCNQREHSSDIPSLLKSNKYGFLSNSYSLTRYPLLPKVCSYSYKINVVYTKSIIRGLPGHRPLKIRNRKPIISCVFRHRLLDFSCSVIFYRQVTGSFRHVSPVCNIYSTFYILVLFFKPRSNQTNTSLDRFTNNSVPVRSQGKKKMKRRLRNAIGYLSWCPAPRIHRPQGRLVL